MLLLVVVVVLSREGKKAQLVIPSFTHVTHAQVCPVSGPLAPDDVADVASERGAEVPFLFTTFSSIAKDREYPLA